MDSQQKDLCLYRLDNALSTLKSAKLCMENKLYRDSINRCYYAAFYAVKAVLALKKIDFKRHKDVVGYFNKEYVATKIFCSDVGKKLSNLQKLREKSDYNDFYISSIGEAEEQMNATEYIVNNVIEYLKKEKVLQNEEPN